MSEQTRIMYVCSECAGDAPESCGHFDPKDLRVMPDGRWLCEMCFDDTTQADRGTLDEDDDYRGWDEMPAPPEYGPIAIPAPDSEGR